MKNFLSIIAALGRLASFALPVGLVMGLVFPTLADLLKAYLIPTLFLTLTLSLLCTPTERLRKSFLRTRLLFGATSWILIISPILVFWSVSFVDIQQSIALAAVLAAAAPPVTAAAAIALFLRLNTAIVACVTVLSMLFAPITLPLVLKYLVSTNLDLNLWSIGFQLVVFIFTCFGVAMLLKLVLGEQKITNNKLVFDGVSVISIILFTIGVMSGVSALIVDRPWFVLENLIVSSALVLFLYLITTVVFWPAGKSSSMAIAIASGNCNLGLMYIALLGKVDTDVLVYFSIGQIPMYTLPSLLAPLVRKLRDNKPD